MMMSIVGMAIGLILILDAVRDDGITTKVIDKLVDKIDSHLARRARRRALKEKYGFDDSYDKYIA